MEYKVGDKIAFEGSSAGIDLINQLKAEGIETSVCKFELLTGKGEVEITSIKKDPGSVLVIKEEDYKEYR